MTDINFLSLSPKEFEELCFDLLDELGFKRLIWRQGGSDNGRDIQGVKEVSAGIVEPYEEVWFFECKRYEKGVPPDDLSSKVTWADAEKPKHLLFFISSYLTAGARDWLSKISKDKPYKIHLVEGKRLCSLVSKSHRLMIRYFASNVQKLIKESHRTWIHHNLIPEPELLRTLAEIENLNEYSTSQLAFLWAALKVRINEVLTNMDDSYPESYDEIFHMLKHRSNTNEPVLKYFEKCSLIHEIEEFSHTDMVYNKVYAAQIDHFKDNIENIALYCLVRDSDGEGLEVLVDQDSSLTYRIRHIASGARNALNEAKLILNSKSTT
jgi:ribosomal protein S8